MLFSEKFYQFWSSKPEVIDAFPEWMLTQTTIAELKTTPGVVIAEIAGRDSFAALFKAMEEQRIKVVVPTIAYTGTEYGDVRIVLEKCKKLKDRLKDKGISCLEPVFLGSPSFWSILCARYTSFLIQRFNFYTPCLGCHLYLHLLRVPLARMLNADALISGERESHDGRIKLNQVDVALDYYQKICASFKVNLVLSIRKVKEGAKIKALLGEDWEEGQEQLKCVLSKNYQNKQGDVIYSEEIREKIKSFFQDFAWDVARERLRCWL